MNDITSRTLPGLYDPALDHDSCGVGFVANIKGRKSRKIIDQGLTVLANLTHRGAVGADPLAGDGAGILIQIPDAFFRAEAADLGIELPQLGHYAVGMVFPSAGQRRPDARRRLAYRADRARKEWNLWDGGTSRLIHRASARVSGASSRASGRYSSGAAVGSQTTTHSSASCSWHGSSHSPSYAAGFLTSSTTASSTYHRCRLARSRTKA